MTGMTVAALKQIVDLAVQGESTIPERKAIIEGTQAGAAKKTSGAR
jgi:hypothetical protein